MVSDFAAGALLSLGAAIMFGAHTSFAKMKPVIQSGVAMPIYNIYFLFGAAIVCFIEYFIMLGIGAKIQFTYLGIIGALLLLGFEVTLLLSIQQIGIGYASGFMIFAASVTAPIVQIILTQSIQIWWVMVIGLLMLAFSVFTMSTLKDALKCCGLDTATSEATHHQVNTQIDSPKTEMAQMDEEQTPAMGGDATTTPTNTEAPDQELKTSRFTMIIGLIFSSFAGIFLATLPLPSVLAIEIAGMSFL